MRRISAAVLAALAASVATACSGGGGAPAAPADTTPITITIRGIQGAQSFSPNPAAVPAGRMVIFRNSDSQVHRVRLTDGSVDTGDLQPGASSQPLPLGNVSKPYSCSLHPNMVGSLNAAATPEPPPCTQAYC
jgi:plastocyanin